MVGWMFLLEHVFFWLKNAPRGVWRAETNRHILRVSNDVFIYEYIFRYFRFNKIKGQPPKKGSVRF